MQTASRVAARDVFMHVRANTHIRSLFLFHTQMVEYHTHSSATQLLVFHLTVHLVNLSMLNN